jgi:hypothetical protein
MIDVQKVNRQTADAASPFGPLHTLPSNSNVKIRMFEYKDADGDIIFAKSIALHFGSGHYLGFCRRETFGKNCLFCEANSIRKKNLSSKLIFRYVVNAIDIKFFSIGVYRLMLPESVFSRLCDYVFDERYLDVLDPAKGRIFIVSFWGKGIDTRYSIDITKKVYPIGDDILSQVTDPTLVIPDRGLDYQRTVLSRLESENGKG